MENNKDVLTEALEKQRSSFDPYLSRWPENQPSYQPEEQIAYRSYQEMPSVNGHKY